MNRFVWILVCAALAMACSRKSVAPAPPEPSSTSTESAPAAVEKPTEPEAPAPASPDVIEVSDTTGDTTVEEPAEPIKTAEGVAGGLERALDAMGKCERIIDSHLLKSPATCLAPVYKARVELRNPSTSAAPDANARQSLRDKLAQIGFQRLQTEDTTKLLYTLQALGSDFDDSPETRARLEVLMTHEIKAIASAAATARLSEATVQDKTTLKLAISLLVSEYADGVRAAACRYIGSDVFRGNRKHVKLLTARALAKVEASVVRGTAVARLGFIGSDVDVPNLARLFRVPATQYAAVFTIQQGLRTQTGFEAIVEWLEGQPKLDKSVQWGTLSAVAPRPDDKAKFPTERAINALMALARSEMQYGRTRSAAVQTIVTLGGSSKLSSLERLLKGKQDPDSLGVLEAVKKALTPVVKP
jgi:hypothetical protein